MTSTLLPSHQWADLLPDLLGRIIARLPRPDDRARFRAVCRPWHLAVRQHNRPQLPWIIYSDGTFVTFPDHGIHHGLSFPDNTSFIGVYHSWLAFYRTVGKRRTYLLHNPFTKSTLSLPGLDSVINDTSHWFEVRKVLMRSPKDDIVVVTTNNCNYPIILCRPGKPGAWWPGRGEMPYASIFDVVFHGDSLCGVTKHNDLVVMDIGEDDDGTPTVKSVKYVIEHPPVDHDDDDDDEADEYESDGQVSSNDGEEESEYNEASSIDEEDEELGEASLANDDSGGDKASSRNKLANTDNNFNKDDHQEVLSNEDEEDVDDYDEGLHILDEPEPDNTIQNSLEYQVPDGTEQISYVPREATDGIVASRHLFESKGKVLMVRRQQYMPVLSRGYNMKVEVLEADVKAGVWILLTAGVSGTFFVSKHYSKHVSTFEDAGMKLNCHFEDEHDVGVDSNSELFTPWEGKPTWFFPQELVV
ncbi:unnamed protein product [Triticum turgidum subsp. durum]|uniref:F-box domain-containing protein n=1 Tax=Triticum turgidum subsp. durum TaxID=4567 RepID=A0A9R0XF84_TRITD|nr:unnamed protein product [Triticum turgidum subsp. durum]